MKKGLHPVYKKSQVVCICGNTFEINSAVEGPIKVESCPECHSVYNNKQETKVIKGRMEKFLEKQKKIDNIKNK